MFHGTHPGALLAPLAFAAHTICPLGSLTACRAFAMWNLETSL